MIHDIDSYANAERMAGDLTRAARDAGDPLRKRLEEMSISPSAFTDLVEIGLDAVRFRESMFSKLRRHAIITEADADGETLARQYRPMSRPDIFYHVNAFLRCYVMHLDLCPKDWGEIAWRHGLPMESPTEEISFCDWMLRLIGKPYTQMPKPFDKDHDPYRILSSSLNARDFVYRYATENRPSAWSLLGHMETNPVLEGTTPNLVTEWLYENPRAQECILSAMTRPSLTGGSPLNPFGLGGMAAKEQQTKNDQFQYLMRDAIPSNTGLVMVTKHDDAPAYAPGFSGVLEGLSSTWADILNRLYRREISRKEQYEKNLLHLDAYMPMLNHCYQNHTWALSVKNLSENDAELLKSMYKDNDRLYVINRDPQTAIGGCFLVIPCTLDFRADGFSLSRPVWLYA